jgi:hypothetical protein
MGDSTKDEVIQIFDQIASEDSWEALDEMRRVARPGAHVPITVLHRRCINFRIRGFLDPLRNLLYPVYTRVKGSPLASLKDVKHYGYGEEDLDLLVEGRGFRKISGRFVNFYLVPHPLDHLAPNLYIRTSEWIDRGGRGSRFKYWGASYLGFYRKIGNSKSH